MNDYVSSKSRLGAIVLCLLFGVLGLHRFYVGKIGTAILYLLSLGGLGTGVVVDLLFILFGSFKDKEGKKVLAWIPKLEKVD